MRGFGPHRREPPALEEAAPRVTVAGLPSTPGRVETVNGRGRPPVWGDLLQRRLAQSPNLAQQREEVAPPEHGQRLPPALLQDEEGGEPQIGRASCRERV